jgi:molecular chaperone DnaK
MALSLGIDLGTSNSVAAYWRNDRAKTVYNDRYHSSVTPSVVYFEGGRYYVGQDAKSRLYSGSRNVVHSVKRFIGRDYEDTKVQDFLGKLGYETRRGPTGEVEIALAEGFLTPVQISALVLTELKRNAEIALGEVIKNAVITVPAYFGQRQKNATREAGRLAGLEVGRVVNEPTAAALAFGLHQHLPRPEKVLVYDFGGGTFDVCILSIGQNAFEVIQIEGDDFLGGDDFDLAIVNWLMQKLETEHGPDLRNDPVLRSLLKGVAEDAKIELTRVNQVPIVRSSIGVSPAGRPINLDVTLNRKEFEAMIAPLVNRTLEVTQHALESARLSASAIQRVLLVGGSTRVPLVRQKLEALFGERIEYDVDPLECVGMGAAIAGAVGRVDEMDRRLKGVTIGDVTAKHLGVEVEEQINGKRSNRLHVLVPKGTRFPTPKPMQAELYTNRAGQQKYVVPVYEVDDPKAPSTRWQQIGVIENTALPASTKAGSAVAVALGLDEDGLIQVTSYLKDDKDRTFVQDSFRFGGTGATGGAKPNGADAAAWFELRSFGFFLNGVANLAILKKYLKPGQSDQARQLVNAGNAILEGRSFAEPKPLAEQMKAFIATVQAPAWEVFWATWCSSQPEVSKTERSAIDQLIIKMDGAAAKNDMKTANRLLTDLRGQINGLFGKIPSDLLKALRA